MIKKAQLFEENIKLRRKLFIFENIGIGTYATIKEKEVAAKSFMEKYPSYTPYEICTTINLSRGTFYNFLHNKVEKTWFEEKEELLTKEIIRIFQESDGLYGQDRIAIALKNIGIITRPETVSKIMKKNGLKVLSVQKRPKPQIKRDRHHYYRNLLKRQFNQDEPNKVWVSDFLEIRRNGVSYYLCVILDLFARRVIAWRLSHKRSDNLALNTFKDAFEIRNEPTNLLFHTDQGAEFTSHKFIDSLKSYGVKQSFSYPGSPNDNACMEGFYSILRREEINIHIEKYDNSMVIKEYLQKYFTKYNETRIHTSNNGLPPKIKEDEWFKNNLK